MKRWSILSVLAVLLLALLLTAPSALASQPQVARSAPTTNLAVSFVENASEPFCARRCRYRPLPPGSFHILSGQFEPVGGLGPVHLKAHSTVATQPQEASGTFAITEQRPVDTQVADGNIILTVDETIAVSGDFEGTLAITTVYNFHPNGRFTSRSRGVFGGTLFGGPQGTLTYSSAGGGAWAMVEGNRVPETFQGQNAFRGTGGGLAGLKGQGSFDAPTYTEFVQFVP